MWVGVQACHLSAKFTVFPANRVILGVGGESTSQRVLDNEMQIRAGHDFAIMSMLSNEYVLSF